MYIHVSVHVHAMIFYFLLSYTVFSFEVKAQLMFYGLSYPTEDK